MYEEFLLQRYMAPISPVFLEITRMRDADILLLGILLMLASSTLNCQDQGIWKDRIASLMASRSLIL